MQDSSLDTGLSKHEERVFLHPFPNVGNLLLRNDSGGGMGTVLQNLVEQRRRLLKNGFDLSDVVRILSFDENPLSIKDAKVELSIGNNSLRQCGLGEFYAHLYDDYPWHIQLHPNSLVSPYQEIDALQRMFAMQMEGAIGTLQFASRYINRYGIAAQNPSVENEMNRVFGCLINEVPPNSIMHWSMHSALPLMQAHASSLRCRNVYQTYHHHFPEPDTLLQTHKGRQMLEAQSSMDALYFHTDQDVKNFIEQAELLQLPIPAVVERFCLGIDQASLRYYSQKVNGETHKSNIAMYASLDKEQKAVLQEIATAEHDCIPHQFACIDRIDAHKGISVLLKGIRSFLESSQLSQEEIRKLFRFFSFHELYSLDEKEPNRIRHQYSMYVKELYESLQRDFPGVIHVCSSVPRDAIAWVMKGRTLLNASIHDGKNLACMEAAYVNSLDQDSAVGLMVGGGAGFAIQAELEQNDHLFHRVEPGDVESVAQQIAHIVSLQKNDPSVLRSRIHTLVNDVILPQQDSVFPDRVQ